MTDVTQLLKAHADQQNELHAVLQVNAGKVRSQVFPIDELNVRCFFIVDECDCDLEGNKHPAHAHIGLCCDLLRINEDDDDDAVAIWAQKALFMLMTVTDS